MSLIRGIDPHPIGRITDMTNNANTIPVCRVCGRELAMVHTGWAHIGRRKFNHAAVLATK